MLGIVLFSFEWRGLNIGGGKGMEFCMGLFIYVFGFWVIKI